MSMVTVTLEQQELERILRLLHRFREYDEVRQRLEQDAVETGTLPAASSMHMLLAAIASAHGGEFFVDHRDLLQARRDLVHCEQDVANQRWRIWLEAK